MVSDGGQLYQIKRWPEDSFRLGGTATDPAIRVTAKFKAVRLSA
jgi:hypothetical protein